MYIHENNSKIHLNSSHYDKVKMHEAFDVVIFEILDFNEIYAIDTSMMIKIFI
jgi:hypothetical protein